MADNRRPQASNSEDAEVRAEYYRVYHAIARLECLNAYGPNCRCCGEHREVFLQLDHIDNDGYLTKDRRSRNQWSKLRTAGYPAGRQVLCANCHAAKSKGVICPHVLEKG